MSVSTLTVQRRNTLGLSRLADYIQLTKPRITVLILVTVAVSGYVARWGRLDLWVLLHALIGTLLVGSSASALNQLLERNRDRLMARTANRPLPAGRLGRVQVWIFALVTLIVGLAYLAALVNWLTALWGLMTWLLYICIYTPLKPITPLNTTVGAVAGAMPVLMGWSAVGGTLDMLADPRGLALFLVLFLWQFPHFMAIAWLYRRQYEHAGLRMLTVVDPSGWWAGIQAVVAALALVPISCAAAAFPQGSALSVYLLAAILLSCAQLACALLFLRRRDERSARRLLRATLLYLPLLFVFLVYNALL
jgi:protoheme IX farnesyltransferase